MLIFIKIIMAFERSCYVYFCSQCICLIAFTFFIFGATMIPDYVASHVQVPIKIIHYNQTSQYYTFEFKTIFQCVYNLQTSNNCNNQTNYCPHIQEGVEYNYYCDCDYNICSFEKIYNFFNSYQFIIMIASLSVIFITSLIILFIH